MDEPLAQLPAVMEPTTAGVLTPLLDGNLIPALIAAAGDQAAWRYFDFFTSNIRNANTRRAYARACQTFFAWCDERGLRLTTIRPYDVATYTETRGLTHSAPDVKQHLAAVRMLFEALVQFAGASPSFTPPDGLKALRWLDC
jgi:hypothetical protein